MSNNQQASMSMEQKLKEYEDFLQKAIAEGKKTIATVLAIHKDECRVRTHNSDHTILPMPAKLSVKIDDYVIVIDDKFIVDVLPKSLNIKKPELKFTHISWKDMGGLKSQISKIRNIIEGPIEHASLYREFGLSSMKGLLLYGPPGVGKTMIAKVIASKIIGKSANDESFIYIKGAELLSTYIGQTEDKIRMLFEDSRIYSIKTGNKSVIFIDEAEAILPKRGTRISSDVDKTIVPTFLAEMDGINDHNPFIILSTNLPDDLDEAIIRPGRIDLSLEITRPTKEDSIEIFNIYFKDLLCKEDKDSLSKLSTELLFKTPHLKANVSGALIKNITQKSALTALNRFIETKENKGITKEDIINTFNNL